MMRDQETGEELIAPKMTNERLQFRAVWFAYEFKAGYHSGEKRSGPLDLKAAKERCNELKNKPDSDPASEFRPYRINEDSQKASPKNRKPDRGSKGR